MRRSTTRPSTPSYCAGRTTRYVAATALLDRGYGRPAQSLDPHLSADAITKRLSDMTDAELAALEARMVTIPASLALEHADEPQADGGTDAGQDGDGCADDAGELPDGDVEDSPPDVLA
jgi:hypothetical protein